MYAEDFNGYVVQTDGNYTWGMYYDSTSAPTINTITGGYLHLGYIKSNTMFRCPTTKPESLWDGSTAKDYVYGVPHKDTLPGYARTRVTNSGGDIDFIFTRRMPDPSRFMGLTDSINKNNSQMVTVSLIVNDISFYSGADTVARYHLRHNNLANTWFYDGHAEKIDIEGVARIAQNYPWLIGQDIYVQTQRFTSAMTRVK